MKQVVQDVRSGETRVLEAPVPQAAPRMALVRTAASLISAGTERAVVEFAGRSLLGKARSRPDLVRRVLDKARQEGVLTALEAVRNRLDQPMPLGYASAGTVVAVGEGLTGFRAGDRVACAGGGYAVHAEYAVVPKNLLARLPQGVDFESGAFATLGAIAMHGFRLGEPQVGERVAVIGLGLLGQLAAAVARAAGCRAFGVDLNPARVELARRMGVEAVSRQGAEGAASAFSQGQGFDLVLICADTPSSDPIELAGEIARDRARIVALGAVGMQVPRRTYYQKELTLQVARSYGPGRYDPAYEESGADYPIGYVRWTEGRNLDAFLSLLSESKLDVRPLITHRFPVEDAADAYELIRGGAGEASLGVLVVYPHAGDAPPERTLRFAERRSAPLQAVRLGALGAGNFATGIVFPTLRKLPGVDLVGVATGSGLSGARAGERFGFRYATTDVETILADDDINTVAVLTRHHLHAGQTIAALEAGKHVFCEKPLALSREELAGIQSALERSTAMLAVGYNRRFAPMARELKAFFEPVREPLAMRYRVNAGPLPAHHWLLDPEQGGGRILGEACHFVDFLTFLCGSLPSCVTARGLPDDADDREDNVFITLEFEDGSVGEVAYLANGDGALPKERLEVFGGGRSAVLDDFRRLELYARGRRQVRRSWLRQDKGHREAWAAWVRALMAGGPPPIPVPQLLAVSVAALGAVEALRSGERVTLEPTSAA